MKLIEVLEAKLQPVISLKQTLGDKYAELESIELPDDKAEELKKQILTLAEAQNSPSLFETHKDNWHKQGKKAALDSLDSSFAEHLPLLNDNEKAEFEALEGSVKKNKYLLSKLKSRVSNSDTNAEKLALEAEYNGLKAKIESEYVPKNAIDEYKQKVSALDSTLKNIESTMVKDHVVSSAVKSGILSESTANSELLDEIVHSAVNRYLESTEFGAEKVKGKIFVNRETGRVVLRQDKNTDISIAEDGKVLSIDDIVKRAITKYNLQKKSDSPDGVVRTVVPANGVGAGQTILSNGQKATLPDVSKYLKL